MMRNKILTYILSGALMTLALPSCSDYLDKEPDDQLDITTAFENSKNLDRWLAYVYDGIPMQYQDSNWDVIADDSMTPQTWAAVGNKVPLYCEGNWTPSSTAIITFWTDFAKRIRSAYLFLEHAHPLADVPAREIEYMKAECRFFIAYYHSVLAMTYGAVPIIRQSAPTTNAEDVMLKQRPFYEVVDWCANEFKEVSALLPARYPEADKYGRATSLWCLAMRARLLTFAASPLVNGNPDMAGMVNCDGEPIFSSEYDPERWKAAAEANMELIEAAAENGYALYEVEEVDGVKDPFMNYMLVMLLRENQGNTEIIMPRTDDTGGYIDKMAAPRSVAGGGVIGVTQYLVDAFFMANGKVAIDGYNADGSPRINQDSGYSEEGFSTEDYVVKTKYFYNDPAGVTGRTENIIAPKNTFNMYCNREPRFYVSVLWNEAFHWGKTHKDNGTVAKYADFFFNGADGRPFQDNPTAGYLMKKRVSPDYAGENDTGSYRNRPGIIYRLAEAYLAYAECLYEYSVSKGTYAQNMEEIFSYINRIRRRAGIPEYGTGELAYPSEDAARSLIQRERRVELNCEAGIRWNDVRRWKQAEDLLDGDFYGMDTMQDKNHRTDFYKRAVYQTRRFISYWWPIPQDDIDRNTNLRQLPGW